MKRHTTPGDNSVSASISAHIAAAVPLPELVNRIAMAGLLLCALLAPLITYGPVSGGNLTGEGNLFRQLAYLVIMAMALSSLPVLGLRAVLLAPPVPVLFMLGWCCMSILWSASPAIGARRLLLTILVIWTIFLLVHKAGYDNTVRVVRWTLVLILAANYLAVLVAPSWAIHQAALEEDPSIVGAWRGVLMQKNFAGVACAFTILFFIFDAARINGILRLLVVAASAIFLYQSHSRTSMNLTTLSLALAGLYSLYKPSYRWVIVLFLIPVVFIAGVMAHEYQDIIVAQFSRPDALTGRVQIWSVLVQYWQDHRMLGSGFGSFWNIGEPRPIALYTRGWVASEINSGHNGYLDLLVQTGLPGLLLAICATALAPLSTFASRNLPNKPRALLLLACIVFSIGHNLTESSLFDRDAAVHVFLMLAIALLGLEVRRP